MSWNKIIRMTSRFIRRTLRGYSCGNNELFCEEGCHRWRWSRNQVRGNPGMAICTGTSFDIKWLVMSLMSKLCFSRQWGLHDVVWVPWTRKSIGCWQRVRPLRGVESSVSALKGRQYIFFPQSITFWYESIGNVGPEGSLLWVVWTGLTRSDSGSSKPLYD